MSYIKKLREKIGHDPVNLVGAVVLIINQKKELLLQQRTFPHGKWGLPGGLLELGESTEEAARREVFEETGLVLDKLTLLGVLSGKDYLVTAENGDLFYVITIAYVTTQTRGQMKVNDHESLDLAYFSLDALPEQMVGSHLEIINLYKKGLEDEFM